MQGTMQTPRTSVTTATPAPIGGVLAGAAAGIHGRRKLSLTRTSSASGRDGNARQAQPTSSVTSEQPVSGSVCPKCGDLGWVRCDVSVGHPDFGKAVRCSCREAEDRARHARRAQAASNLKGRLLSKTFETFDCARSPSARIACDALRDFAEEPQGWTLVQGNRGTGKTHLLVAVANQLIARGDGRCMPLYVVAPDFLDYLRAGYDSEKVSQNAAQRMEDARNCPVLLLDDLGAEKRSEWTDEQLYRLLNYRYNEGLATVVASNVTLDKLEPRIASRLQDASLSRIVLLAGEDQRVAGFARALR